MIAEKAADLIRGREPLPPADTPVYRHEGAPGAAAEAGHTVPGRPRAS